MDEMGAVVVHGVVKGISGLEKRNKAVLCLRSFGKADDIAYLRPFPLLLGKEDAAEAIHTQENAPFPFMGCLDFVDLNDHKKSALKVLQIKKSTANHESTKGTKTRRGENFSDRITR
jgi:hypothetical protein